MMLALNGKECLHDGDFGVGLKDCAKSIKSPLLPAPSDSSSAPSIASFDSITACGNMSWLTAPPGPRDDPTFSSFLCLDWLFFLTLPVSNSAELDVSAWKSYEHIQPRYTFCRVHCENIHIYDNDKKLIVLFKMKPWFYLFCNTLSYEGFRKFICRIRCILYTVTVQ